MNKSNKYILGDYNFGEDYNFEQYLNDFNKLICKYNFFKKEKEFHIKNIYKNSKKINDKLIHLNNLEIEYGLYLVGGAVRDFLLQSEPNIKDFDFFIKIESSNFEYKKTYDYFHDLFQKSELNKLEKNNKLNHFYENYAFYKIKSKEAADQKMLQLGWGGDNFINSNEVLENKLIELCFDGDIKASFFNTVSETSPKKTIGYEYYEDIVDDGYGGQILESSGHEYTYFIKADKEIFGVIKLKESNYIDNIDLIISNKKIMNFLDDFDFDFCKATIVLKDSYETSFPNNYKELLNRNLISKSFFKDYHNKTFSIRCVNDENPHRTAKRILNFFVKYPEYRLKIGREQVIINKNDLVNLKADAVKKIFISDNEKMLWKCIQKNNMENILNKTEINNVPKKTNKI